MRSFKRLRRARRRRRSREPPATTKASATTPSAILTHFFISSRAPPTRCRMTFAAARGLVNRPPSNDLCHATPRQGRDRKGRIAGLPVPVLEDFPRPCVNSISAARCRAPRISSCCAAAAVTSTTSSCRARRSFTCCARPMPRRASSASTPRRPKPLPGVLAVLTGKDADADKLGTLPRPGLAQAAGRQPEFLPPYRILALDRVRHVGDPVAAIVAETLAPGQGRGRTDRGGLRNPALGHRHRRRRWRRARPMCGTKCPAISASSSMSATRRRSKAAFAQAKHVVKRTLRHQPRRGQPDGGAHRARRSTIRARSATCSMPGCRRRI